MSLDEDEHTRDEIPRKVTDRQNDGFTENKLTLLHSINIRFAHSFPPCFIKNAPRFARRSFLVEPIYAIWVQYLEEFTHTNSTMLEVFKVNIKLNLEYWGEKAEEKNFDAMVISDVERAYNHTNKISEAKKRLTSLSTDTSSYRERATTTSLAEDLSVIMDEDGGGDKGGGERGVSFEERINYSPEQIRKKKSIETSFKELPQPPHVEVSNKNYFHRSSTTDMREKKTGAEFELGGNEENKKKEEGERGIGGLPRKLSGEL